MPAWRKLAVVRLSGWVLAILASSGAGCANRSDQLKAEDAAPVTVASASVEDVPRTVRTFGTVEASSSVEVRAQVQGLITDVHFHEGDFVERGQLLFTIDTRPYQASLAAAQAELARSRAVAEQARVEAERELALKQAGVASEQELARARADAASTAANVRVEQARAKSAGLNVALTRVTSPITGRTGGLLVHAGNIVRSTDAQPLVVVKSLAPVYVSFSVSQEHLAKLRAGLADHSLRARVSTRGDQPKTLAAPLTFLDNTVDTRTGTVAVKATYANLAQELWPGSTVEVELELEIDRAKIVVPEAALQRGQSGTRVFVVGADGRALLRSVEVLRTTETLAVIGAGLAPGERVVTDGQLRLRSGSRVSIEPSSSSARPGPQP